MNPFGPDSELSSLDPQLIEIVDEVTEMFAAGREPKMDELCLRYPQFATTLTKLYPAIAMLAIAGVSASGSKAKATETKLPIHGMLGDFQIVRELGRGGMGVVYEAEQLSLGRRVALKILPFAGMLDSRQLARFKNESKAAAALRHPNIVGVHAVGVERGVHYYAMEMIEGQCLSSVITDLRATFERSSGKHHTASSKPSNDLANAETEIKDQHAVSTRLSKSNTGIYRAVADIGIQAAEALEYAHRRGVVHRDVKPANLLLNHQGQLFVTDFGLARIETDSGLTVTGDLLGTVRYMSPEQASGNPILDQRTDVYSLGLVLYELLALRPAFNQSDRNLLLREIAEKDPPPPSRFRDGIPKDLETIVLKAIAKQPHLRFASAQEFADDLKRFLEHRPIAARRVGRLERTWRWAYRNRPVALLAATVLTVALLLAILGPLVAWRQYHLHREVQSHNASLSVMAAYHAWDQGDYQHVKRMLSPIVRSAASEAELSFEVRHLWNRVQHGIPQPLLKHAQSVEAIAYTPDGSRLMVASGRTLRLWDLASISPVDVADLPARVSSLAVSADGSKVALGYVTGQIELRDSVDLELIAPLSRHIQLIQSVAFSPDGTQLASASDDEFVLLWDVAAVGAEPIVVCQHPVRALGVCFSPDGRLLATSGAGAEIVVFSLPECEPVITKRNGHGFEYRHPIAFMDQGRRLVSVATNICIWDTTDWELTGRLEGRKNRGTSIAVSPDSRLLAIADIGPITLVNIENQRTATFRADTRGGEETPICFTPDGTTLTSGYPDGSVRSWKAEVWSDLHRSTGTAWVTKVDFARSTGSLFVSRGQLTGTHRVGTLHRVDLATGQWIPVLHEPTPFGTVGVRPTDPELYAVSVDADGEFSIQLCTDHDGVLAEMSGHPGIILEMEFSPDGKLLVASSVHTDPDTRPAVSIWDVARRRLIARHDDIDPAGVDFSPDGRFLVVVGETLDEESQRIGCARIYDLASHTMLRQLACERKGFSTGFSPDGRFLAVGSTSGTLQVWDTKRWETILSVRGSGDPSVTLAFSIDGRTLAVAAMDQTVRLWETSSWQKVGTLHVNSLATGLKFGPDDRYLAAGCLDGSVAVWHVDGRKQVLRPGVGKDP